MLEHLSFASVESRKPQEQLQIVVAADEKLRFLGRSLGLFPDILQESSKHLQKKRGGCSLLRILGFAGLLLGARGQRMDPFPAEIELSSLDGTNGFLLNGIDKSDHSGFSVSSAGDFNGDGIFDILIGAHLADPTTNRKGAGKSFVVFGGSGLGNGGIFELSSLNGTNGFVLHGEQAGDNSGYSVSNAGDLNGDGITDIVIGAYRADPIVGSGEAGRTYVLFGDRNLGSNSTLELSSLNGTSGFVIYGEKIGDHSGESVSSAGDVNGDGTADLLIGAPNANPASSGDNAGKTYVIFGHRNIGSSGALELSLLNGTQGFVLNGVQRGDHSGESVSRAGDVNGDGFVDILVGATNAFLRTGSNRGGRSYIIFGGNDLGNSGNFALSNLNGTNGFILFGENKGDLCGFSVSSAGDVNGDGANDFLIGAPHASAGPRRANAGKTYLLFGSNDLGRSGTIKLLNLNSSYGTEIYGAEQNDNSGISVSGVGDVNGDGMTDILIGAYLANSKVGGDVAGRTYLLYGSEDLGKSGTFDLAKLVRTKGIVLKGDEGSDRSGFSVSSAGDVNGDGIVDLIIGAPGRPNGSSQGKSYIIFGRNVTETLSPSTTLSPITVPHISPSAIATTALQTTRTIFQAPASLSLSPPLISTKSTPVTPSEAPSIYIGVAVAVTALCCSLLAGGLLYAKRKVQQVPDDNERVIALDAQDGLQKQVDLQAEKGMVAHHNYSQLPQLNTYDRAPDPAQIYEPVNPEEPGNGEYHGIDDMMLTQENAYDSPSSPLT